MPVSAGERSRSLFFLAVALLLGASIVHLRALAALLIPVIFGLTLLLALTRYMSRPGDDLNQKRIVRWTLGSFIAHLLFSLAIYTFGGLVADVLRGPDSITYNARAIDLVRHWTEGLPPPLLPAGKEGYYYLLGGLYWLLGPHVVAGLAVNALLSAALVPLVTDTTRRLFGSRAAHYAAPLVVLLPGLFLWTSQLGKEAPALFLIAVAANAAVRLVNGNSVLALVSIMASIAILFAFRGWVALTLAGGLLAGIALSRRRLIGGVTTGVSTTVAIATLVVTSGIGYSGYQAAITSDLKQANAVRAELALTGRTGFDEGVDVSTGMAAVSYLPKGLARLVIGPFPWQLRGVRQLPGLLEVVAWWILLPSLWGGLRRGWRVGRRRLLVVILPTLTTAVLLSLSIGNFGTQLRERLQVVLLLVPVIALGLAVRRDRRGEDAGDEEAPTSSSVDAGAPAPSNGVSGNGRQVHGRSRRDPEPMWSAKG